MNKMFISKGCVLSTISALAMLVGSATAFAQSSSVPASGGGDAADTGVGDIIVTAQKREQKLNDVGMSISALSGDDLVSRGVASVEDLVRVVPGFSATTAQFANPVYTIRGVGFYESSLQSSPAVTVYTDEVPLPYPAMTSHADLDLERVEVLKGPQGLVFGQNSTGGAINFIAARPTSDFEAGLNTSYERFGLLRMGGFASGPLSDMLKVRVAARAHSGGKWQKAYTRRDKLGAKDLLQGRVLLDFQPTERLNFVLNVNGWRDKSDPQAYQLIAISPNNPAGVKPVVANFPLPPNNARAAEWVPGAQFRDNSFYQFSLRSTYDVSDAITLTSVTAYEKFEQDEYRDFGLSLVAGNTDVTGYIESFSQELRLSGETGRFNWIIGANYGRDSIFNSIHGHSEFSSTNPIITPFLLNLINGSLIWDGTPYPNGMLFEGGIASVKTKVRTLAAFANVEYKITDALTFQVGARYTDDRRRATHCNTGDRGLLDTFEFLAGLLYRTSPELAIGDCVTFNTAGVPGPASGTLHENNWSWRTGLNWKINPDALLYANVSRGYKAGSFPTIASAAVSQFFPVTQERLTAYEAGFKVALADRRIQLNGAAFYYDYVNKQLRGKAVVFPFGNLDRLLNIPKSRLWGVEGSILARPVEGLDINLGATYLNSKVTSNFTAIAQDSNATFNIKGNSYPYTPKLSIVADAQYSFPINGNGLSAFFGGGVTHNSSTTADIANAANFAIPAYTLVDVRAGVAGPDDQWRFMLYGKNIFDEFYWTNVSHSYDTNTRVTGYPAVYGVSFSYRF